jgi:hypothetical protein
VPRSPELRAVGRLLRSIGFERRRHGLCASHVCGGQHLRRRVRVRSRIARRRPHRVRSGAGQRLGWRHRRGRRRRSRWQRWLGRQHQQRRERELGGKRRRRKRRRGRSVGFWWSVEQRLGWGLGDGRRPLRRRVVERASRHPGPSRLYRVAGRPLRTGRKARGQRRQTRGDHSRAASCALFRSTTIFREEEMPTRGPLEKRSPNGGVAELTGES